MVFIGEKIVRRYGFERTEFESDFGDLVFEMGISILVIWICVELTLLMI